MVREERKELVEQWKVIKIWTVVTLGYDYLFFVLFFTLFPEDPNWYQAIVTILGWVGFLVCIILMVRFWNTMDKIITPSLQQGDTTSKSMFKGFKKF